MKFFGVITLALALSQSPVDKPDADSDAIRKIVADQALAWNAGDAARYASYGRDAFERRHSDILGTFYKGTKKSHVVRRVRLITPDVAIVDIDNEVRGVRSMPAGIAVPAGGVIKTQLMEIFVKRNGRWWVEAYHNVDVKTPN